MQRRGRGRRPSAIGHQAGRPRLDGVPIGLLLALLAGCRQTWDTAEVAFFSGLNPQLLDLLCDRLGVSGGPPPAHGDGGGEQGEHPSAIHVWTWPTRQLSSRGTSMP